MADETSVEEVKRTMRELAAAARNAGSSYAAMAMQVRIASLPMLLALTSDQNGESIEVLIQALRLNTAWLDKGVELLSEALLRRSREVTK